MAGARYRQVPAVVAGRNGKQERTPEDRHRGQVREGLRFNDRRRAGRPGCRTRQRRLVFPINPGQEEQSWDRFYREGIDRFFNKAYAASYEASLIEEFEKLLPEVPPWKVAVGR